MTELSARELSRRALMKSAAAAAAAGAITAASLQGMAESAAAQEPVEGGTLSIGVSQITSNSHMLHLRHFAGSENIYTRLLANARLVTLDNARTTFVGALAESWEFNEDSSLLTFTLRQGLTWHDDAPFTAADVDFTYHMIGVPGVAAAVFGSSFATVIVGMAEYVAGEADSVSGLTVVDDFTVSFELFPGLNQNSTLSLFNQICIAPNHILSEYLDRENGAAILESAWATTAEHVGIGPFKVVEYVADQYIRYEPFENYYNGKPLLGEVIYRPFADAVTLAAALENQEIMVGRIPVSEYERISALPFLTMHTPRMPGYTGTPFNARQPYLNKAVRQGLIHAIDRETIASVLYQGTVEVVHTPIEVPGIDVSPNLKKYEYDPEKAAALLAEGGWDTNQTLRWHVGVVPSDEATLAYYAAVNGYWEEVGVKADFDVFGQDATVLWGPDWNFDLYPSTYPIGFPSAVALHFDPRQANYVSSGFDTPEFRELWDTAFAALPPEEEVAAIHALQEYMAEEALTLSVIRSVDIWGIGNNVHGLTPNYFPYEYDLYDWALEKVWVDPA